MYYNNYQIQKNIPIMNIKLIYILYLQKNQAENFWQFKYPATSVAKIKFIQEISLLLLI